MPKKLNVEELNELKEWLQGMEISYKNLHRDFSDAVPVAGILKKLYPKLVDIHNYPSRNNTKLKFNNWETLNSKVLSKLELQQNKNTLENLAQGRPGAIEGLLYEIMLVERNLQRRKVDQPDDPQEQIWKENDDVVIITVNKKIGDALVQVPQKMILYSIYEQVLKESQAKDYFITSAQQKITHLENVIQLKAERIDELCAQLAKVSVKSLLSQSNLQHSNSGPLLMEQNMNTNRAENEYFSKKNVTV